MLLVEDSRGLVEIHRDGRIRTQLPLDDAVQADLEGILEEAMGRSSVGPLDRAP